MSFRRRLSDIFIIQIYFINWNSSVLMEVISSLLKLLLAFEYFELYSINCFLFLLDKIRALFKQQMSMGQKKCSYYVYSCGFGVEDIKNVLWPHVFVPQFISISFLFTVFFYPFLFVFPFRVLPHTLAGTCSISFEMMNILQFSNVSVTRAVWFYFSKPSSTKKRVRFSTSSFPISMCARW